MENQQELLAEIQAKLTFIAESLIQAARLEAGSLVILGCSSSEIMGKSIGRGSNLLVGKAVVETLLGVFSERGIWLAVQGCEHINRALTLERKAQQLFNLPEVTVVPALKAGGSCSLAAYALAKDPVVVSSVQADAGIDIGDTSIGQYVKSVQIPFRAGIPEIGGAHVTCLCSRPPLIGGERAQYVFDRNSWLQSLEQEKEGNCD